MYTTISDIDLLRYKNGLNMIGDFYKLRLKYLT